MHFDPNLSRSFPIIPRQFKTSGFAICIILGGGGGLVSVAIGVAALGGCLGWWNAGVLAQMGRINAIVMISVGGSIGGILFLIGGVGNIKIYFNRVDLYKPPPKKQYCAKKVEESKSKQIDQPNSQLETEEEEEEQDTSYDYKRNEIPPKYFEESPYYLLLANMEGQKSYSRLNSK